jgi:predicted esterase
MDTRLSRRALLIRGGGAAAALVGGLGLLDAVAFGRIGGRGGARCGQLGALPAVTRGPIEYGSFRSAARQREVGFAIVFPPGANPGDPLPLCLYLHGRGGSHHNVADPPMGIPWFLADRVAAGAPPMAILAVDGGNEWWHRRATGADAARMLTHEVVPLAAARGLRTHRMGLLGTSMGGFGALLLAQRLGRERIAAVGAMSPALAPRYRDAYPGAFDSRADYDAHDVFAGRGRLAGIPVRIDCGRGDRFAPGCLAFLDGAPDTVVGATPAGCHDTAFWRAVVPRHVEHVARALGA